jgi:dienelactone hydrolase
MSLPTRTAGLLLLLIGVITFALTLVSYWLVPGRPPAFARTLLIAAIPAALVSCIGTTLVLASRAMAPRSRQILVVLGAGGGMLATLIAAFALERGWGFPFDQTTGPKRVVGHVVLPAKLFGTGVCRCAPDRIDHMLLEGGFVTRVAIYDKGGPSARPGVVLIHGNTWRGSDLSTYRLLATRLAKSGFIVLTFDFPGFGAAESPFGKGPELVSSASDDLAHTLAAVDYLAANTDVDLSQIAVFGHSGGTDWALRAAATDPRIGRVAVMFGPPIPPAPDEPGAEPDYQKHAEERAAYFTARAAEQHRLVYGTGFPEWHRWELTLRDERFGDDIWEHYRQPDHKSLKIVLAEFDQPAGHEGLRSMFAGLSEPKTLFYLARSNHYLNTAQTLGLVFYDRGIATDMVDGLVQWMRSGADGAELGSHRNGSAALMLTASE